MEKISELQHYSSAVKHVIYRDLEYFRATKLEPDTPFPQWINSYRMAGRTMTISESAPGCLMPSRSFHMDLNKEGLKTSEEVEQVVAEAREVLLWQRLVRSCFIVQMTSTLSILSSPSKKAYHNGESQPCNATASQVREYDTQLYML